MHHDVIILGGGASGVFCAIACKDFGLDVAILEGTDRICKKLLTTGNGRCNITNKLISSPFERYHSDNEGFFSTTLSSFSVDETINFFRFLGLPLITLEEGKMYPQSLQASSAVDILRYSLDDRNIPLYTNHKVINIKKQKKGFELWIKDLDETVTCGKLIFACGGKSAAATGSDGSGYNLAKSLGHSIINPVPALVQLKSDYKYLKAMSGIKLNGFAEVLVDDIPVKKQFGEILFTDYGLSGPPLLQLSRIASKGLSLGKNVTINIDLMYSLSKDELENFLEGHFAMFGHRSVLDVFIGIINKKLIPTLLKECLIDNIHKPAYELTWQEKQSICNKLKSWCFNVTGTNGFNNAQVTAGGVNTKEISEITLESNLCPNLYFCGEILDVDGDCGGFNLQWSWSSAMSVAKACRN